MRLWGTSSKALLVTIGHSDRRIKRELDRSYFIGVLSGNRVCGGQDRKLTFRGSSNIAMILQQMRAHRSRRDTIAGIKVAPYGGADRTPVERRVKAAPSPANQIMQSSRLQPGRARRLI